MPYAQQGCPMLMAQALQCMLQTFVCCAGAGEEQCPGQPRRCTLPPCSCVCHQVNGGFRCLCIQSLVWHAVAYGDVAGRHRCCGQSKVIKGQTCSLLGYHTRGFLGSRAFALGPQAVEGRGVGQWTRRVLGPQSTQ